MSDLTSCLRCRHTGRPGSIIIHGTAHPCCANCDELYDLAKWWPADWPSHLQNADTYGTGQPDGWHEQ